MSLVTSAPSSYNISDTTTTNGSVSTGNSCSRCQVFPFYDAPQGPGLVRVSWYSGEVPLTLATKSVVLTQYDNYTVTGTTTIQNDINTLNASTISGVISLASDILGTANIDYGSLGGGVILANGTDGAITGGGSTSIPYPTPYLKIDGFDLYIPTASPLSGPCEMTPPVPPAWATRTLVTLSNYYYSAITPAKFISGNFDVENLFPFDNSSFSNFLASDTALMNAYPELKTCYYLPVGFGPPAVKMSVSAVTATTTATVKGSSSLTTQSPQPASSIVHSTPASTTVPPVPSLDPLTSPGVDSQASIEIPQSTPIATRDSSQYENPSNKASLNPSPSPEVDSQASTKKLQPTPVTTQDSSQDGNPSNQASQQNPAANQDSTSENNTPGHSPQSDPKASAGGVQTINFPQQATDGQTLESQAQAQSSAAPVIPFHGSTIQADSSSQYDLPGIGNIRPGGEPVTTNNVVYSLAPSATAIISNGNAIALTPISGFHESMGQNAVLTFAGSAYSLDSSSNIVIAGQTLKAGSEAITVSNTRVSLAPGASIAIIGSSTQSLKSGPVRTEAPVITYGDSTYTASSSAFTIDGQKLTPGGQITVSGTPISLHSDGSVAVIGSSTQNLRYVMTTPAPLEQDHVISFGGSIITAESSSAFVIAGETLTPGGEITVSGTPISLAPGANIAVIGSSTQQLGTSTPTDQERLLTFGGSTFTAGRSSYFTIAGQTLSPGGVITVSGTPISLGPSATIAVIGSSTQQLEILTSTDRERLLTFGGSTFTPDRSSYFTIAGQTLSPGGVITVSGTPISLGASATIAVIGSSTEILASAEGTQTAKMITFGGSTYTADSATDFVIAGQTLTPDGVITVSGTAISLDPSGTIAVIGSSTQTLASTEGTEAAKLITFGGSTYTADTASDFVIAGQTLTAGGVITISGTPISLDSSATFAIIGSSTEALASLKGTETVNMITFGGSTYTADAASDFIVAGQTLTPGGVITVSGTTISYASSGSDIVVGGTSESVIGLATYIMSGLGPTETSTGNGSEPFLGAADSIFVPRGLMLLGIFGVGCLLAVFV